MYKNKRKGKIIYVTATVVCHIANHYGQPFLALPFAIGYFGLTSVYQTLRKGFVSIVLGAINLWIVIVGTRTLSFALILAFHNLDFIPTSPIDVTKNLKTRIPGMSDVVVMNNRDKIIMSKPVSEKQECFLVD